MSRKPSNPASDRAAQNAQTIKSLLKLEPNKVCADCKRNKHPRWASWNLGVFVCIRCSGIHRGMGTHISRVKSVDLDAWTDEQLHSVLVWGNARANKYWEAKLAPDHVPSEAKIENFIRTKYESKRWVMDGPMPDPATLDVDGDDDIPLNLVKEKHSIDRSASQRSSTQSGGPSAIRRAPQPDLFGDDPKPTPRAASNPPPISNTAPKAEPAPPKQTKPADSLLGLDFFATPAAPPNRPSSAAPLTGTAGQSRPDLKQSILSLYASAPRSQAPQQPQHSSQPSFGSMQSQQPQQTQSSFGGLNDAFSGLSFTGPTSPTAKAPKTSAFAGLGALPSQKSASTHTKAPSGNFGGGSFFDAQPAQKPPAPAPAPPSRAFSSSSGFGAFDSAPGPSVLSPSQPSASSGLGDLFDFGGPSPAAPKPTTISPPVQTPSVFNLSTSKPVSKPQSPPATMSGWNNNDAWGSNDAWSAPEVPPKPSAPMSRPAPPVQTKMNDFGWGSGSSLANQSIVPGSGVAFNPITAGPPKVAVDEEFGGWSSAAPVTPGAGITPAAKKTGGGYTASEDLFSNVWE